MAVTVTVHKVTTGTESERLLDALSEETGLERERLPDGRSYYMPGVDTWEDGVAGLQSVLDRLSDTWSIHLGFRAPD